MVHEFSDQSFDQEVIKSEKPVVVDFWAPWCGPCMMMSPIMEDLAEEFREDIKFGKINVDLQKEIASKYDIMSIPVVKIFKDGKEIKNFVGLQGIETLREELKKII